MIIYLQIEQLKQLYGAVKSTDRKIQCYNRWKTGKEFGQIAGEMGVKAATAEIYVIDEVFVRGNRSDCSKLLSDIGVSREMFNKIKGGLARKYYKN